MVNKYTKEFELPFEIKRRIQSKTKKLNDCNDEFHGWVYESNLLIKSLLQYLPDKLVEKIIRYTVYLIAWQYEESYRQVKTMSIGSFEYPDGVKSITHFKVAEEAKYHISVPYSEIKKMESAYKVACKQIIEDLEKRPISVSPLLKKDEAKSIV